VVGKTGVKGGGMFPWMIKQYLEHHLEPNPSDNFRAEPPTADAS